MRTIVQQRSASAAFLALIALSFALAVRGGELVSEVQLSQANQSCLIQETGELDDRVSDVTVMGRAAVSMCSSKREDFLKLLALNYGPRVNIAAQLPAALQKDLEAATYFILKRRSANK